MYSLVKSFKDRKSKGELPVDLVSQLKKLLKLGDIQLISVYWLQSLDGFPDQIILFQFLVLECKMMIIVLVMFCQTCKVQALQQHWNP